MIYTRIGKYGMIDAFRKYGRLKTSETHGNFTEKAIVALFDYYDELENYELDVVGICCEWTQYMGGIYEVRDAYLGESSITQEETIEYLEDNTYHIVLDDDSILVRDF